LFVAEIAGVSAAAVMLAVVVAVVVAGL